MKKLLILPAIFFCLSFSTIHKKAEIKLFAPSAGLFLYIPSFSSAGGNPGTTGAGVLANHLDEVSIDASSENQAITLISGPTVSTSKPQIGDYVFTKSFDKSSLRLKKMLYTGSMMHTANGGCRYIVAPI